MVACALALGVGMVAASALAQDGEQFVERTQGLQDQVQNLEQRYLDPALVETRFRLESRFNDGKVAYMLGDYSRASLLLVDIVEDPRGKSFDSYREALFLLGDSLYQQRSYLAARNYFTQLAELGPGAHYQDAIVKLLEVAAKTRNYEEVEELYESLGSSTALSPAVNYMRGKTLFQQERYTDARTFFQQASSHPDYDFVAPYYRGVSFAADNQLANAHDVFKRIVDREPESEDDQSVVHLAYLGLGRVAYEQGNYDEAIDYYQHLPRTSPEFDRALYELTWTLVAQEKYKAASRVVDIFLYLSNPDPTFVPKVKLLKADLHLRLEQYERSEVAYEDVVSTFQPVKTQMNEFVARNDNVKAFFSSLVEKDVGGAEPEYVPPIVKQWVEENDTLAAAKLTLSDLQAIREDIDESRNTLDQIEARLGSGARIQSFPKLAEGLSVGIEVENRLIDLREAMLEREYELLESKMTDAERQEWAQLEARAEDIERKYDEMPKTRQEVRERGERVTTRFDRLRSTLDDISYEIDTQEEQLEAIDAYLDNNPDHGFTEEELDEIAEKKRTLEKRVSELKELRKELQQQVAVARQQVGVGDEVTDMESRVRQRYREQLSQQRNFLSSIRSRANGAQQQELRTIASARRKLPEIESRLEGFFRKMNGLVGDKTQGLRQSVRNERRMLDRLDNSIETLIVDAKDVTAGAAYASFVAVKRDFDQIILRGDVGLVDVAWRKKEDKTKDINQLFENRTAELKALQESFEEIR